VITFPGPRSRAGKGRVCACCSSPRRTEIDAAIASGVSYKGVERSFGITASTCVVAWLEYLMLKRLLGRRIGPTGPGRGVLAKLWASAGGRAPAVAKPRRRASEDSSRRVSRR
jgi:hypothetical protein